MDLSLMSALAMLGGLVLAGVVAHGAWTAHKASPKRAEPPSSAVRREPSMVGGDEGVAAGAATGNAADANPTASAQRADPQPSATPDFKLGPLRRGARLDPLIDAIAPLTLEQPVSGEMALMQLPPTRRAGTKPFMLEGLNTETGDWEFPRPGQRYGEFQAGLQLANRSGALNAIEYSEFVQKLQGFADAVGAMLDPPDMAAEVARAKELDAFASQHDPQLAITLRANAAAWSVGYVQQSAGRHGFVPGVVAGRWVLPSTEEGDPPLLALLFSPQAALADDPNISTVREVTLSLDVPQSPESAEPFPAWHNAARVLAADMDASLVDDQGRVITLHAFADIGSVLADHYRALEMRDLAAGSAAARRLFS